VDSTHHGEVRAREFASLDIPGKPVAGRQVASSKMLEAHAQVKLLATGFFNISGAAVDAAGKLYFVDAHWQRIYSWSAENQEAVVVRNTPLEPENLAFDKAGDLLVVSRNGNGKIYSFRPDAPEDQITMLEAQPAQEHPEMSAFIPANVWNTRDFTQKRLWQFLSPDHGTLITAGDDFVHGQLQWGTKMADVLRAFGLVNAVTGHPFYVTAEDEQRTYKGTLTSSGSIADLHLFAEEGGEGLAQDQRGDLYLAAGQVLVYSSDGKKLETMNVPERPIDLIFGGPDRRTLYILTHHSLYSVRTLTSGL
jgi:sugar lactone lactonase YvrE